VFVVLSRSVFVMNPQIRAYQPKPSKVFAALKRAVSEIMVNLVCLLLFIEGSFRLTRNCDLNEIR